MSRFPVDEIFWRRTVDSELVSFGRNYPVLFVEPGTEDPLTLWSEEVGGVEVPQPLVTDDDGRAVDEDGLRPWLGTPDYDILIAGERYPKRAPSGGGAVDSVNGQEGVVVLDAGDVGAATPGELEDLATKAEVEAKQDSSTAATDAELAAAKGALEAIITAEEGAREAADALKADKTYVEGLLAAADAVVFKGVIDCSASPNYPAADAGHTYRVSVAGEVGGASGTVVEVGDLLLCLNDSTAAGNQATVGSKWNVTQTNLDGAVIGPAAATSGNLPTFSGTSGKLLQDSGKSVSTDNTLAGNSDALLSTQKAVKGYVDTASGLLVPKSTFTTKGDAIVGTGAGTLVREAVGADGTALLADSAEATGRRWGTPKGATIACRLATTAALAAYTRTTNKLEATANGALATIDSVAPTVGDYFLLRHGAAEKDNGVFKVTSLGAAGAKWTMERVPEMDTSEECRPGMLLTIAEGELNADTIWQLTANGPITLNTTSLTFSQPRLPRYGCRVRITAPKSIPNAAGTAVAFDNAGGALGYNRGGVWSSGSPTQFVAPITGSYSFSTWLWRDDENNTDSEWGLRLGNEGVEKNGIASVNHDTENTNGRLIQLIVPDHEMAKGQTVVLFAFQDSGSTRKIVADEYGTDYEIAAAVFKLVG
jgi:hypothetical protein